MMESTDHIIRWVGCGAKLVAVCALLLGGLSAAAPQQSIKLYQWIMAGFNWRVVPIDERRELRNTKTLGLLLVGLSLVLLWRLSAVRL